MTLPVSIVEATEADLRDMIALRCEAAEEDVLTRFLYGHRHVEASKKEGDSLMVSLGRRFTHPTNRCHIVKAIDSQTQEMLGWGLVRWEDGSWVLSTTSQDKNSGALSFPAYYSQEVKGKWREILAGKPHVVIGALNVRVDHQRQGVGKQIVDYMYTQYDLGEELVIVQTRGTAEQFYQKLGWVTVDCTNIDLSKWGGEGAGFGWHRSPQMVRYPVQSRSKS